MKGVDIMSLVKWRASAPADIQKMSRQIAREDGIPGLENCFRCEIELHKEMPWWVERKGLDK